MERSSNREKTSDLLALLGQKDEARLSTEVRKQMSRMIAGSPAIVTPQGPLPPPPPSALLNPAPPPSAVSVPSFAPLGSPSLPSFVPAMLAIVGRIRQDLDTNLGKLLDLNRSRREAIVQHLEQLAGQGSAPRGEAERAERKDALRRWVEGPRSPVQEQAVHTFCEEVALVCLGQSILLKAWSDRGQHRWNEEDLGRLNWAMSTALKSFLADREGWQITRPNLYSWYNPSTSIQREIWSFLSELNVSQEGPSILADLLRYARQSAPDWPELRGYDPRFFSSLWRHIEALGISLQPDTSPLRRRRTVFSPTLRDGLAARTGPQSLTWVGLEAYPFQLMMAELAQLWSGPSAPPLWAIGTGLEVHARDQLALQLGSPQPSLLTRISDMEACDLSFVFEERSIRLQTRSSVSHQFRDAAEPLEYFKKLRSPGATLGDLQACVAVTKLRPGGLLCWLREEPLGQADGEGVLSHLLERARLICEWDFSELSHSLPSTLPLFPRYMYLFSREANVERRISNRPTRISLQGQIRSHIEVPLLLEDALQAHSRPPQSRGQWQIHVQVSPIPQKEWSASWPGPAAFDAIRSIEELRVASAPLGSLVTVRFPAAAQGEQDAQWFAEVPQIPSHGALWVRDESDPTTGARHLTVSRLSPGRPDGQRPRERGFLLLAPDAAWIEPLRQYLESGTVRGWLDHHVERKSGKWHLTEKEVKWIPVPKLLVQAMSDVPGRAPTLPLGREWELLVSQVATQPRLIREALCKLPLQRPNATPYPDGAPDPSRAVRASVFVRTAQAMESLRQAHERLLTMVAPDGRILWSEILDILPRSECCQVTFHSKIKIFGALPPHQPIARWDRVKTPMPGILFSSENGMTLQLGSESAMVLDMIWDQLSRVSHVTWNELVQFLRLPRQLEIAESTATDVLRSHGEVSIRLGEMRELLTACLPL